MKNFVKRKSLGFFIWAIFILALSILFPGCNYSIVQSPAPWFIEASGKDSEKIVGRWACAERKTELIIEQSQQDSLRLHWCANGEKTLFSAALCQAGKDFFLQVMPVKTDKEKGIADLGWQPSYMIFKVDGFPQKLNLKFPDTKVFSEKFAGSYVSGWPFRVYAISGSFENSAREFLCQPDFFPEKSKMEFVKRVEPGIEPDSDIIPVQESKDEKDKVAVEEPDTPSIELCQTGKEYLLNILEIETEKRIRDRLGLDQNLLDTLKLAEGEYKSGQLLLARRFAIYSFILNQLSENFAKHATEMRRASAYLENSSDNFLYDEWLNLKNTRQQKVEELADKEKRLEALLKKYLTTSKELSPEPASIKLYSFPGGDPVAIEWYGENGGKLAWAHLKLHYPGIRKSLWKNKEKAYTLENTIPDQIIITAGNFDIALFIEAPEWLEKYSADDIANRLIRLQALSKIKFQWPDSVGKKDNKK